VPKTEEREWKEVKTIVFEGFLWRDYTEYYPRTTEANWDQKASGTFHTKKSKMPLF
jgi:hypothetical protein